VFSFRRAFGACFLLTKDEARWIAANIARQPDAIDSRFNNDSVSIA